MIDPKKMIALWDTDDKMRVVKLVVVDIDKQNAETDKLPASSGASDQGWMEGNVIDTPMGLYCHIATYYGFASHEIAKGALKEFGKVEGQEWVAELQRRVGD